MNSEQSIPAGVLSKKSQSINLLRFKELLKHQKNQTKMKKNMSSADRIIRLIIVAILVTLYFTNVVSGTLGVILLVVAGVFTLTSLIGFCPLYSIFGCSTCKIKK